MNCSNVADEFFDTVDPIEVKEFQQTNLYVTVKLEWYHRQSENNKQLQKKKKKKKNKTG